jgi:hypothetical protein
MFLSLFHQLEHVGDAGPAEEFRDPPNDVVLLVAVAEVFVLDRDRADLTAQRVNGLTHFLHFRSVEHLIDVRLRERSTFAHEVRERDPPLAVRQHRRAPPEHHERR